MNRGLPTSLRLGQPTGGRLTYSPHQRSPLQDILGIVETMAGSAEEMRKQKRKKEIMDVIMQGGDLSSIQEQRPEPAGSTLGRILQGITAPFDPRRSPVEPIPLETTIAETMFKHQLETKTKGKMTEYQEEDLKIKKEKIALKKKAAETKGVKAKMDYAFDFVKTFAALDDKDLKEKGLLVEMNNQRNYLKKISSLQRYASDVDDYYDRMLQLYKGDPAEALKETQVFMQRLGITQEMLEPYMRER